jgi:hypothetical protein
MTLTLSYKESETMVEVLRSAQASHLHTARYRMNAIQLYQQTPFSEIPKPPASSLKYSMDNYYEWDDLYKALNKLAAINVLLVEFGWTPEYPEVEEFVPRKELEPEEAEEILESVSVEDA